MPCLFGRAEFVDAEAGCDCAEGKGRGERPALRDLAVAVVDALLLKGDRTSPLLDRGPAAPPFSRDDGVTVSVHVRSGDSCDVVTRVGGHANWALLPYAPGGAGADAPVGADTDWPRARRF